MGKYDFIKLGNLLYWHDPDSGLSNGVYQVASIPENIEEDSVILIASDTSEAEVFPSELSPIHTGRSHKEDFLRWKTEREAEGIEFYDHLSKVMDTENDLSVGDMVAFTNDYGVIFGPCEVLAFGNLCNSGRCVYSIYFYCIYIPITRLAMLLRTPSSGTIPFLLVVLRF